MENKFECLNCNHRFLADDRGDVSCPYCQSDNVRPIKESSQIWGKALPVLVGLLVATGSFFCTRWVRLSMVSDNDQSEITYNDDDLYSGGGNSAGGAFESPEGSIEGDNVIPKSVEAITVNWTGPQLTGTTYSLDVTSSIPADQVEYVLSNFDKKYTSSDGHFRNIPATETGVYSLVARNKSTGEQSDEKVVSGFVIIKANIQKMSVGELQRLVDNKDNSLVGAGANSSISPDVRFSFVNLQSGEKAPQVFTDIFGKIRKEIWVSVTVQSVSYDSQDRISSVTFRITYPESE